MLFKIRSFKYTVLDEFGDSLKNFYTRDMAKDFVRHKPNCKIIKYTIDLNKFEEALF